VLEESESDVLLLLDCCHAGTANTNEGNGVTEIISACPYNSAANGVGPYSFTQALVTELENLATKKEFSTGELYTKIYCRTQIRLPDDGAGIERHPPPIHLVLNNDSKYRRSIHLAKRLSIGNSSKSDSSSEANIPLVDETKLGSLSETSFPLESGPDESVSVTEHQGRPTKEIPRLALAIRFNDDLRLDDSSADLFLEWLRTMPLIAQQVRVEAGFESFSSLLIVSIPISLYAYLSYDPAVICLGPITSSNRIGRIQPLSIKEKAAEISEDHVSCSSTGAEEHPEKDKAISYLEPIIQSPGPVTPRLERRNSNAPSMTSSISTVTSASSDAWPVDASPPPRSLENYSPDMSFNEEESMEYPIKLQEFGDRLTQAGGSIFSSGDIAYIRVSCLLLSWEGESSQFPLSHEIPELAELLRKSYNFDVEQFKIPTNDSNANVMAKIAQFLLDESPTHLKIVYYGGSGKVYSNGRSEWRR